MKKQFLTLSFCCLLLTVNAVRWTELNALDYSQPQSEVPHIRSQCLMFNINNKIYYGGGFIDDMFLDDFTDFYSYDPSTGKWAHRLNLPFFSEAFSNSQSFIINNKGYFCGTDNSNW